MSAPRTSRAATEELHIGAVHESGHAVLAHVLGARLGRIWIDVPRADGPETTGNVQMWFGGLGAPQRALILLAGAAAQAIADRQGGISWAEAAVYYRPDARFDFAEARAACNGDEQLLDELWSEDLRRLARAWPAVEGIAAGLLARRQLSGQEARQIVYRSQLGQSARRRIVLK